MSTPGPRDPGGPLAARVITIPENQLAAEIECAIAYLVACNKGRWAQLLTPEPNGCRREFAHAIAAMLTERAASGLSGMTLEEAAPDGTPAD
jgi:hypothetical protein